MDNTTPGTEEQPSHVSTSTPPTAPQKLFPYVSPSPLLIPCIARLRLSIFLSASFYWAEFVALNGAIGGSKGVEPIRFSVRMILMGYSPLASYRLGNVDIPPR